MKLKVKLSDESGGDNMGLLYEYVLAPSKVPNIKFSSGNPREENTWNAQSISINKEFFSENRWEENTHSDHDLYTISYTKDVLVYS